MNYENKHLVSSLEDPIYTKTARPEDEFDIPRVPIHTIHEITIHYAHLGPTSQFKVLPKRFITSSEFEFVAAVRRDNARSRLWAQKVLSFKRKDEFVVTIDSMPNWQEPFSPAVKVFGAHLGQRVSTLTLQLGRHGIVPRLPFPERTNTEDRSQDSFTISVRSCLKPSVKVHDASTMSLCTTVASYNPKRVRINTCVLRVSYPAESPADGTYYGFTGRESLVSLPPVLINPPPWYHRDGLDMIFVPPSGLEHISQMDLVRSWAPLPGYLAGETLALNSGRNTIKDSSMDTPKYVRGPGWTDNDWVPVDRKGIKIHSKEPLKNPDILFNERECIVIDAITLLRTIRDRSESRGDVLKLGVELKEPFANFIAQVLQAFSKVGSEWQRG